MNTNRPTIIMIGSAGSGKGTQSQLLAEQLGYHIVEAGAIFRKTALMDTPLGREVKAINDSGKHASDQLITDLLKDYITAVPQNEPLLIDGYPRSLGQSQMLVELLKQARRDPDHIVLVYLNVTRQTAKNRLLNRSQCSVCQEIFMTTDLVKCPHCSGAIEKRAYDTAEAIDKRLDFFAQSVLPVIEYYKNQGKLIDINGEQEVVHVFEEIKNKLQAL